MANLNKAIVQGRLTADPELRKTSSDISVTSFTVAVNKYVKDSEHPQADFIDIVAWRGTAELVAKYFTKGSPIIVEGSLQTRNYEAKDGSKRKAVEIVANNVYFDGKKNDNASSANDAYPTPTIEVDEPETEDEEPY